VATSLDPLLLHLPEPSSNQALPPASRPSPPPASSSYSAQAPALSKRSGASQTQPGSIGEHQLASAFAAVASTFSTRFLPNQMLKAAQGCYSRLSQEHTCFSRHICFYRAPNSASASTSKGRQPARVKLPFAFPPMGHPNSMRDASPRRPMRDSITTTCGLNRSRPSVAARASDATESGDAPPPYCQVASTSIGSPSTSRVPVVTTPSNPAGSSTASASAHGDCPDACQAGLVESEKTTPLDVVPKSFKSTFLTVTRVPREMQI